MKYFVQSLIHPYAYLDNLEIELFKGLNLDYDTKQQALNFLVLNVWFDNFEKQIVDLGLAYYTVKQYFENNDDFIIVVDPEFTLREEALAHITRFFPSLELKIPFYTKSPPKDRIIQSFEDFKDGSKILNTALYLTLKYCKPNLQTIACNFEQVKQVGRVL